MATDSILTEQTDYERGYEEGVSRAVLIRHPGSAAARIAELEAEVSRLKRGIDERDRAIRDAAARVADVVEPCVVCRRMSRVGTGLCCEACR